MLPQNLLQQLADDPESYQQVMQMMSQPLPIAPQDPAMVAAYADPRIGQRKRTPRFHSPEKVDIRAAPSQQMQPKGITEAMGYEDPNPADDESQNEYPGG